jgi:hypothetical protein
MLISIGQKLREVFFTEPSDAMPDHLRGLLDRLSAATTSGARGTDTR